jgi:hypothetical protein
VSGTCGLSRVLLGVGASSCMRELILTHSLLDDFEDGNKNGYLFLQLLITMFTEVTKV